MPGAEVGGVVDGAGGGEADDVGFAVAAEIAFGALIASLRQHEIQFDVFTIKDSCLIDWRGKATPAGGNGQIARGLRQGNCITTGTGGDGVVSSL